MRRNMLNQIANLKNVLFVDMHYNYYIGTLLALGTIETLHGKCWLLVGRVEVRYTLLTFNSFSFLIQSMNSCKTQLIGQNEKCEEVEETKLSYQKGGKQFVIRDVSGRTSVLYLAVSLGSTSKLFEKALQLGAVVHYHKSKQKVSIPHIIKRCILYVRKH